MTGIIFNPEKATLLIGLDKKELGLEAMRMQAQERGLQEKAEFHLTIIGSRTGAQMLKQGIPALNIHELAKGRQWRWTAKPEFYYIEKDYEGEKRSAIIQMVDLPDMDKFYKELRERFKLYTEAPMPHVTLFSGSTSPATVQRGVGIYSEHEFREMNPERL